MLSAFSFEFNTQSSQLKKVYIQKGLYLLPFPLAYETTVSESKLHSRWGGVGWGREKTASSDTEIEPFSPWLLVALNLGRKKKRI